MVLLVSIIHQKEVFSRGMAGLRGGTARRAGGLRPPWRGGLRPPHSPGCAGAPCGPLYGVCTGRREGAEAGRRISKGQGQGCKVGQKAAGWQAAGASGRLVGAAQQPDEVRLPAAKPRGARPQGARCAAPFPPAQSQKRESNSSADFWLVRVYRGMRMRQAGSRVSRQGLPSTPREAAKPSCSKSCWLWRLYEPKG